MDQILGSTSSLHRAARLMRSESSMPTASSCDAIRILRGRTVHMDPYERIKAGTKIAAVTKSTGLGPRQQRGFLNTWLPNYWPHSGDSSNFWPPRHRICFPNSQHMTTLPTFENICLSHISQTDNSQKCVSHMSTGTVLSSIVLLTYSFHILQCSTTIKHGTWSPATSIQRVRETVH